MRRTFAVFSAKDMRLVDHLEADSAFHALQRLDVALGADPLLSLQECAWGARLVRTIDTERVCVAYVVARPEPDLDDCEGALARVAHDLVVSRSRAVSAHVVCDALEQVAARHKRPELAFYLAVLRGEQIPEGSAHA